MAQIFETLKKSDNNITKFEIYPNNGGDPIDITQGVTELYYYENVLSESVKLTVFVVDTGNAQNADDGTGGKIGIDDALKLGNGEKIYLEFMMDGMRRRRRHQRQHIKRKIHTNFHSLVTILHCI